MREFGQQRLVVEVGLVEQSKEEVAGQRHGYSSPDVRSKDSPRKPREKPESMDAAGGQGCPHAVPDAIGHFQDRRRGPESRASGGNRAAPSRRERGQAQQSPRMAFGQRPVPAA